MKQKVLQCVLFSLLVSTVTLSKTYGKQESNSIAFEPTLTHHSMKEVANTSKTEEYRNFFANPPSLSKVSFVKKVVTYNGQPQNIEATNVPKGVTVTYDQTDLINAGVYTITASFFFEDQLIGTKTAVLTINGMLLRQNINFNKKKVTYDGTEHELTVTVNNPLPGLDIKYSIAS